ncbi:Riboflavin biosynthesis protein RibD [Piscirickettsia salmonis]|uniref:bifunctional diaminohydroxyphosphoribosylaminopyrimidine deaminase/5-amino-6-(5-phosphoribosylamino)uracil reductase RibD n=1 Tax=Piscirickettsia salmonis TaxID=1238 RepID=UPI0012B82917|nr:bifunctional diaminohydroxyphosphoribosylaminopyrimidine deaminase/5-amino-6-(5-phosphoribosylamino)uracil reductase RibD [Piscirickettsia salmonis]QGP50980.1 Riboflavin biosynthesis protein RibD [Piscirickettsia salmonis]QGP55693.1 Riboflavin biosynthesis protein RibD [Piscirickettsia salmonis]QGP58444.1 Riboflavin biosynthesis protein RibD [Piscirickettsia salmonis]QGP65264.1 Riboflavin biosynthesis protein RibD [Piscirickettsia salmonis]
MSASLAQVDDLDHLGRDQSYMQQALRLAERGRYTTKPNPCVGCVLVKENKVAGEGYHQRAGGPHAEVYALRQAGEHSQGATAYVTLEPCAHTGRTGPCAEALIAAKVSRVVVAMQDPFEQVAGQGIEKLRAAGIRVTVGVCERQARDLNPGFITRVEKKRPWIRIKMAQSLDGRTAMASGESQWITGPESRQDVQRLRARSSAIFTGIGTVLHDNPELKVRAVELGETFLEQDQPMRVIVDSQLSMPLQAKILKQVDTVLIITSEQQQDSEQARLLSHLGINIAYAPMDTFGKIDLVWCMRLLAEKGINELHVEAGATLAGALMQQGLCDELVIYMATVLLGSEARPLFDLSLTKMSEKVALHLEDLCRFGDDMRLTLKPVV